MPGIAERIGSDIGANVFTVGRSLDSLKSSFFDRDLIIKKVDWARRRVLSKAGAFVRTRAQSSMLRHVVRRGFGVKSKVTDRAGVSAPGEPPFVHTGLLVKFILFAWDENAGGVVVGPMKTNQVFFQGKDRRPVTGTVPQVLEYGGQITILEWFRAGVWQRADLRSKRRFADRPTRYRTVNIASRPFMRPALAAERLRLPELFKDTVR